VRAQADLVETEVVDEVRALMPLLDTDQCTHSLVDCTLLCPRVHVSVLNCWGGHEDEIWRAYSTLHLVGCC
jgi:hypothetical protein